MGRRLFGCFGKGSSSSSSGNEVDGNGKTNNDTVVEEAAPESPIMVELFSSQGCAMSPAAELLLSRLGRGDFQLDAPVIVLAYHVDYWDYMGWKDPYGSSQWTVRQKAYVETLNLDTMFTPQVVVQGRAQCVPNDEDVLLSTIATAPRFPAPSFQANIQRPTSETLQVTITGALRFKVEDNGVHVMVALYENGLVNDCSAGENKGKVLSNDFVVRKLEKLCNVEDTSAKKTISGTVTFSLWDNFNHNKCAIAVFAENSSHQIFGSQKFQLPDDI
ncbi:uncharacterized protein LOC108463535 [Gossypium arboreum]|uniref:uncharacterized protein LOC108463535 n=1 Tax=Gossypium arboreum TaxID=29729 RepID=UPI00081917A4|nr:uncharacterized protein LOC108463535 [Gossypium arboreum]